MKRVLLKVIGAYFNTLAWLSPNRAAKKGLALLCHPFRGRLTTKHRAFFDTAEKITVLWRADDVQVYQWKGGETKILFLHGWQSHSYMWKRYIEMFDRSRYSLYAFDAPGHGLSTGKFLTMPYYSEVIQEVIRKVGSVDHVIGHSLGSFAALHSFHTNPETVPSSIVLLSSPGKVEEFFDFFKIHLSLSTHCITLIKHEFEKLSARPVQDFAAPLYASSIQANALLIHDELDPEIAVEHSRAIHAQLKKSVLITTTGKGHNLRSQDIVDLVVEFIENGKLKPTSL